MYHEFIKERKFRELIDLIWSDAKGSLTEEQEFYLALAHLYLKNVEEAKERFTKLHKRTGKEIYLIFNLIADLINGDIDKANKDVDAILEKDNNVNDLFGVFIITLKTGMIDRARDILRRCFSIDKDLTKRKMIELFSDLSQENIKDEDRELLKAMVELLRNI